VTQIPLEDVSYHVTSVRKRSGLIVLADSKPRRTSVEHFYCLLRTPSESSPTPWEGLARATTHPLRVSILEILGMDGGRALSPNELSKELQIALSNTSYHPTELAEAGLIVPTGTKRVRGATEHFYRLPGTSASAPEITQA
jgi:hypothetical protein